MSNLRVLSKDYPRRILTLTTKNHALIFQYNLPEQSINSQQRYDNVPRCQVEFASLRSVDLTGYRVLGDGHGTLGLITLDEDVFICVVTGSSRAATVRPGETVSRIDNVDFYCLNRSDHDAIDNISEASFGAEELHNGAGYDGKDSITDHPFLALKKLLSDGTFYYSLDFNLTDRLQDRSDKAAALDVDALKEDMLWNLHMIHPLLLFRSHLPSADRRHLDNSQMLTCVIRGFSGTLTIPASVTVLPHAQTHFPSAITIISRQSSRRAGTRFNSRGIDDDGNVANFVETEIILWTPPGITFSYVQVRGSVPIFWEQAAVFLPGQQKIEVTRSTEATRHAFNKHFEALELQYGAVHVVNLLSELKSGEAELSAKFQEHIRSSYNKQKAESGLPSDHTLLRMTNFDFHAEARGPLGYGASSQIKHEISHSLYGFAHFLSEENNTTMSTDERPSPSSRSSVILQQEGVFRTNCLDCLDRTNLVQTIISSMALEAFVLQQRGIYSSDIQLRHSSLWADNGDALSKIYAGTGALKSSYTRHGKMSFAGALADARKTATRLYVSNFADGARQRTMDLLLGRLADQVPVHIYDPINDLVSEELLRRSSEYSYNKSIKIWTGTFNVNGRLQGPETDLSPWLLPRFSQQDDDPLIYAVGFQEIVALSPQQIMSTDPTTRKVWESAVKDCLNARADLRRTPKYALLRSGQLVGTALMIYVREDALKDIKNVEGNIKKTGLSGMAGNKGGCAIRLEFSNTRICFVTAHLAAGFANDDERNRDYDTICHGLRFQNNKSIEDHDAVIWLGDFNYRVGLNNQLVRDLILEGNYEKLYNNDQLNLNMLKGRSFRFYTEGPIMFPPTYKFDIYSDNYDTSEKSRIPAWCDRILWRGSGLSQSKYDSAKLYISDHRPVWAIFSCTISVIDEEKKNTLRRTLYTERQDDVHNILSNKLDQTNMGDEEVSQPKSSVSGLPLASSDNHKWWLENGTPAKSLVDSPDGYILNPHRKSNPFYFDEEDDWVSSPNSTKTQWTTRQGDDTNGRHRFPPRDGTSQNRSSMHGDLLDFSSERESENTGSGIAQTQLHTAQKAPPIPRKPVSLSSQQERTMPMSDKSMSNAEAHNSKGHLAGNIRCDTSSNLIDLTHIQQGEDSNLLDGHASETVGWKPLVPQ
ncbi:SacI domain and endonuclease/exonuclease/phosphatase family protein [Aspergillus candidus]|uniref:phosphoinositide 5-phosphatase n=1 Tax=Aspergillus candidus TaxID=41067 RepID=A0A2I2F7W0_ASPCN|nr:DNase I-like protein [Aspergillus candidus]PLB36711.1 DNase I-like protein [Aspergillus candidus]